FPAIPRLALSKLTLIRESALAASSRNGRTCGAVLPPSAVHNSQLEYVWSRTDAIIFSRNWRGVLKTGTIIEINGRRARTMDRCRSISAGDGSYRLVHWAY